MNYNVNDAILAEALTALAVQWCYIGTILRKDNTHSTRLLRKLEALLFVWLLVDMSNYILVDLPCPKHITRIAFYLAYLLGNFLLWGYTYFCKSVMDADSHRFKKWHIISQALLILCVIDITVSFWGGRILNLDTFIRTNGLPIEAAIIQVFISISIPFFLYKNIETFGLISTLILVFFGMGPSIVSLISFRIGSSDFSVVSTGLYSIAIIEILQNANSYKQDQVRRQELEELNNDLANARLNAENANKAKSQFLANMSHEIRTPINAVLGMDTMILRRCKDKDILKYAIDIQNAGRNLLSLINDILDFSKIESGKMELIPVEYDFSSLVYDVYNMINAKAREKELEFVTNIDESIPNKCFGDDVRLRQIVINLLTNAVKYTPNGRVTLDIKVNSITEGNTPGEKIVSLMFSVRDTGIGIKPEDIDKLTEKFVRIEETRNRNIEGTGLGINIVNSLLMMMNSRLEVESIYGEGSNFFFNLDQKIIDEEPIGSITDRICQLVDEEEEYTTLFEIPETTMLVVDDNTMNRTVFKSLLSDMKCDIDEADSGEQCLKLVQKNKYDIIFMDHMMPEMDGVETFNHMQEFGEYINSDTPVVILTANALNGAKEEYLSKGFDAYLSKPIDVTKLEDIIGRMIPDEKKYVVKKKAEDLDDSSSAAGFPFIDGVDFNYALNNLRDAELLIATIEGYSQMATSDIYTLQSMYEELQTEATGENFADYRIQVHSMKSNVATIGANHLAGLAKYLEYAARDEDFDTIKNLMPLFVSEWNKLKSEVDEAFGLDYELDESNENLPLIDVGDLMIFLDSLNEAMDEADLDRADVIIEELQRYSYPEEQKQLFSELKMGVMNIDTGKCEKIIEKWKGYVSNC